MKNNFSFKNLFRRMTNVSIPKEFIYFGIGAVLVILIGLIASNMHLQEMLFFEGQEKSIQLFTEEELREYGEIYKEMSLNFEKNIGYLIEDYANRTNRAGERIHYGIYNHEHPTDDTGKIKIHNNGQNINAADDGHISDYDDSMNKFSLDDSYIDSDEFKNGVTVKYAKTSGRNDGESNYKDILTVVSMLIDQKQSDDTYDNENKNLKSKVADLIKYLYKMTHVYQGESTELYACEKGCRVLFYYCNEVDNNYVGTGINLQPFSINSHDEFDDYGDEDFEIKAPEGECEICEHNGKGCELDSAKCYHGTEDEESGCKHTMSSDGDCTNCQAHSICTYEGEGEHDCSDNPIGCGGHYDCDGHEHWNCPGHFYVCCMGHTDISVNIKIMYIDEIVNTILNGYNVGEDDD